MLYFYFTSTPEHPQFYQLEVSDSSLVYPKIFRCPCLGQSFYGILKNISVSWVSQLYTIRVSVSTEKSENY